MLRSLTRSLQAQLSECARLPPLSAQHAHTGTALRTFVAASGPTDIRWTFLGPPGVGKGTYADIIAKRLGVAHVATGDLIRHEIKTGTPLGLQVRDSATVIARQRTGEELRKAHSPVLQPGPWHARRPSAELAHTSRAATHSQRKGDWQGAARNAPSCVSLRAPADEGYC